MAENVAKISISRGPEEVIVKNNSDDIIFVRVEEGHGFPIQEFSVQTGADFVVEL
jgi:hypothetical protein